MMSIDDIYNELSPFGGLSNSKRITFYKDLVFIWVVVETDDYISYPILSLSGIGQVHVPIFNEVISF